MTSPTSRNASATAGLRVGVLLDRLEVGGVEKVAIQQVAALRDLGHDATLMVLRRRGEGIATFANELSGMPIKILEDRLKPALRGSLAVPGFAFLQTFHFTYPFFARHLLHRDEVNVVICHGSYTCLTGLAVQRKVGIPMAAFLWDPTHHVILSAAYAGRAVGRLSVILDPLARRFDRWLVRSASLVVLGGDAYGDYVRALGPRRLLLLHPAAAAADRIVSEQERRPEILAVTAWKAGKCPGRLLELLRRHSGLRLVLAGAWLDPMLRGRFAAQVTREGLEGRVEVTGPLSEAELGERYAHARLVVQGWPSPGFGLSPLEAAAHGTTFVIPRGQGSAELFREGVDGLFYDPDRPEGLIPSRREAPRRPCTRQPNGPERARTCPRARFSPSPSAGTRGLPHGRSERSPVGGGASGTSPVTLRTKMCEGILSSPYGSFDQT